MDGQSYEDYWFYQQKQMGAMTMIMYVNKVQASDRVHTLCKSTLETYQMQWSQFPNTKE